MKVKIAIFAVWGLLLVLVDRYLIDSSWGQLVYTGVSAAVMTHAQHLADRRRSHTAD